MAVWHRLPICSGRIAGATRRRREPQRRPSSGLEIAIGRRRRRGGSCPGICRGIPCPTPSPAGRSCIEAAPSVSRRARHRLRGPHSGRAGDGIRAHNTLSPETTHVHVFYPFHPLHDATLQIVRKPKRDDGAVSIIEPTGRRLKIPVWMLLPECAEIKITERPRLSREALLSLTLLLPTPHN